MKFLVSSFLISVALSQNLTIDEWIDDELRGDYEKEAKYFRIEAIDFSKCDYSISKDEFYQGIIYSFFTHVNFLPLTPAVKFGVKSTELRIDQFVTISNYNGPSDKQASYSKPDWGNWQWLPMNVDVRDGAIPIKLNMLGGMGELYVPLLHPDDSGVSNKAIMLRISPSMELLNKLTKVAALNWDILWFYAPDSWSGTDIHARYTLEIKLATLLKHIVSFYPRLQENDFVGTAEYSLDVPFPKRATPDTRNKPMKRDAQGTPGVNFCPTESAESEMTFSNFDSRLKKVMPWL